jgi:hypothetical protein
VSNLLKLKEWLTLSEAAKHLTLVLEEDVAESDVLQFSLDGDLTLSVQFVNAAYGAACVRVDPNELVWDESPALLVSAPVLYAPKGGRVWETDNIYYQIENHVIKLKGIWDLPLTGGERIDVQREYQKLMSGPVLTEVSFHGVFVKNPSGVLYKIQTSIEPLAETYPVLSVYGLEGFQPAVTLPNDRVFVIRTTAIIHFIKSANKKISIAEEIISSNENGAQLSTEESEIDPLDFPEELDAARMAFWAVKKGHGDKAATFKNRLIDYLEKNYSYLGNEAVQRIATVANPDKARGRKKFDKE